MSKILTKVFANLKKKKKNQLKLNEGYLYIVR